MAIINRTTRLRIRRLFRRHQKNVEAATVIAGSQFDNNFIARFERLLDVQRFVLGWIILVTLVTVLTVFQTVGLSQYYLKPGPVPGGVYNEGMIGTFSNANPLYASGPVDTSLSRLLFAGLFKYNEDNKLTGDLARDFKVDESGKTYTVRLKQNLKWHDGKPLTADDVVFTFKTIKNPDAKSPLFTSWNGIGIRAKDKNTVIFTLPSALTAFPHSLTTGIIPEHVLGEVPADELRGNTFNTTMPVGAGPFVWDALQLSSSVKPGSANATISLKSFEDYNSGVPKLNGFVLHTYDDETQMLNAYKQRSIEAIAGLKNIPEELKDSATTYVYNFPTTAATFVFFKTNAPILDDVNVRKALVYGADRTAIIRELDYEVRPVREPILIGQLGYDKDYQQPAYDPKKANELLDKAGWVKNKNGIRMKDNQLLQFQVLGEDTPDDRKVLDILKSSWRSIGISMQPVLQQTTDFQSSVETHSYGALLYGVSIGPDPDVYAYWGSTQADPRSSNRLNFSEYKSSAVDTALESGRTRQDPLVRVIKYKPFLEAWRNDAPALALYQPNALYLSRGPVAGLTEHLINTDADRYYSVAEWTVKTGYVPK